MAKRERNRIKCRIDELPLVMREQADAMIADPTITYQEIADCLTEQGYEISKSSIGRYAQRTGKTVMRMQHVRENANALISALHDHRGLELSDVTTALVMDNLIQALSDASVDDFSQIPLAKQIDLVLKQQRNEVYRARMMRNYRNDMDKLRKAMVEELAAQVQYNPELVEQLEAASILAAEKVVEADEQGTEP